MPRRGNRESAGGVNPHVRPESTDLPKTGSRQPEAEFRDFVAAFSPTLIRTASLLLGDRDAAEDATQLALLRTFRRWNRASGAPEAYTHRALVNACHNHWRYLRRHPIDGSTDGPAVADGLQAAQIDERLILEEALRQLPAQQRDVLVLRFFVALSVTETAQVLEIPEGTVKSATHRALQAMRTLLSDETQEVHDAHRR